MVYEAQKLISIQNIVIITQTSAFFKTPYDTAYILFVFESHPNICFSSCPYVIHVHVEFSLHKWHG